MTPRRPNHVIALSFSTAGPTLATRQLGQGSAVGTPRTPSMALRQRRATTATTMRRIGHSRDTSRTASSWGNDGGGRGGPPGLRFCCCMLHNRAGVREPCTLGQRYTGPRPALAMRRHAPPRRRTGRHLGETSGGSKSMQGKSGGAWKRGGSTGAARSSRGTAGLRPPRARLPARPTCPATLPPRSTPPCCCCARSSPDDKSARRVQAV